VKFTNVMTKIEFSEEDLRIALADYVDLNHNRPKLAESIRNNNFKVSRSKNGAFSLKVLATK
jgi:hypothetical protein